MISLAQHISTPKGSNTRRQIESLALLLALACLLVARVWPALPLKTMAMMPKQISASMAAAALEDETHSHHNCFDVMLRCKSMLGGFCPLTQANCALVSTSRFVVPQVKSPLHVVGFMGSSLWPSVPKQPPRR
jgi:hypothetical protein